jgi:hypothetical protein
MKRNVAFVLLAVGLACAALAASLGARTWSFVGHATRTEGKVVALDAHRSSGRRHRTTYRPVFEFKDSQGTTHHVTERVGSNPAAFDRGETVTVLYNPENPAEAHIKGFTTLWFGPTMAGGFGLVLFGIGGAVLVKRQR